MHRLLALGRGILLFGAHFGSYEATRVLGLSRPDIRFRTVIDIDQNPMMSRLLNALNPALAATVINSREAGPMSRSRSRTPWRGRARRRCSRTGASRRQTAETPFWEAPRGFRPQPWELAAALGAPVMLCFGVYRGGNRYHLCFERSPSGSIASATAAVRGRLDRQFADRLGVQARNAP